MPRKTLNLQVAIEDVFGINSKTGMMFLGGNPIPENELKNMQEEVKFIEATKWWKVCQETLRQKAIEKAIYNSTSFDDMRNAKEMLEVLNLLIQMNSYIKSWKPQEEVKKDNSPVQY